MNATAPIFQQVFNGICAPQFPVTYCSSCGEEFGPGEHGYSLCDDHLDLDIAAAMQSLRARSYGGLVYIDAQHAREARARDDKALALQIKYNPQDAI